MRQKYKPFELEDMDDELMALNKQWIREELIQTECQFNRMVVNEALSRLRFYLETLEDFISEQEGRKVVGDALD